MLSGEEKTGGNVSKLRLLGRWQILVFHMYGMDSLEELSDERSALT
jgi:hypothetical protein